MNVLTEILVTAAAGGIITAVGFVYKEILQINVRLARIEEHLAIETKLPINKK